MSRGFTLFELLMGVGVVQGVVTTVLLLVTKRNALSNRFLACAVLMFCLLSFKILLHSTGLHGTLTFRYFPLGIELGTAPLVYFYAVSLITPGFRFRRVDWLHFLPFAISQSYATFVYLSVWGLPTIVAMDVVGERLRFGPIKRLEDYLAVVSIFSYLLLGFFKLRNYRERLKATSSDNSLPTLGWLMNVYTGSAILGLLLFANLLADAMFDLREATRVHWQVYFIYLAVLMYALGLAGYMQPQFRLCALAGEPKPRKGSLPEGRAGALAAAVEETMTQDRLFLNPTLSAQELARHLDVSQTALSQTINREFQRNFRDYVNAHRVEEVKRRLIDGDRDKYSLLAIALDSGFNSEASFYRAFKKFTGQLPGEFGPSR